MANAVSERAFRQGILGASDSPTHGAGGCLAPALYVFGRAYRRRTSHACWKRSPTAAMWLARPQHAMTPQPSDAARRDQGHGARPCTAAWLGPARWHVGTLARSAGSACATAYRRFAGPWAQSAPPGTTDLASLARAVSTSVPARRSDRRLVTGRHDRARTRATTPRRHCCTRAHCHDAFVRRARRLARRHERQVLDGFAAGLARDYRRTIANFLALQTWGDERASTALRTLRANLASHGEPDHAALVAGLDILRETDLRGQLSQHSLPTLVIAGEHDRITPATAGRKLAAALPQARFVEIAKAGHAPFLSHPAAVLSRGVAVSAHVPAARDSGRATPASHRGSTIQMTEQAALTPRHRPRRRIVRPCRPGLRCCGGAAAQSPR